MTDWSYEPLNSSHRQYSISSSDRPMQIFLPSGPSLPTSMSVPRWALLRRDLRTKRTIISMMLSRRAARAAATVEVALEDQREGVLVGHVEHRSAR
jgi:hypothetical protein